MVITNWGKRQTALLLTGSNTSYPTYFMIGSGSGTSAVTDTTLIYAVDRQLFTSTNGSTFQKIKWTGDWTSVEMSGIQLREFGVITSGAGVTGSIWSKVSLPAISFDGTNELRLEENWEVY